MNPEGYFKNEEEKVKLQAVIDETLTDETKQSEADLLNKGLTFNSDIAIEEEKHLQRNQNRIDILTQQIENLKEKIETISSGVEILDQHQKLFNAQEDLRDKMYKFRNEHIDESIEKIRQYPQYQQLVQRYEIAKKELSALSLKLGDNQLQELNVYKEKLKKLQNELDGMTNIFGSPERNVLNN